MTQFLDLRLHSFFLSFIVSLISSLINSLIPYTMPSGIVDHIELQPKDDVNGKQTSAIFILFLSFLSIVSHFEASCISMYIVTEYKSVQRTVEKMFHFLCSSFQFSIG